MAYNELIKTELKYREKLINTYYSDADIYELKRALASYFKALNKILETIEKD